MQVCHKTHRGLVRASNQDNLLIEKGLYGVADGMGGHNGGETASLMTIEALRKDLQGETPDEERLRSAIADANQLVYDRSVSDNSLSGMGTTAVILWEDRSSVLVANVGDSRAYRFRDGVLTQITTDHSLVAELLRSHAITPEMAKSHPYRNVITRAVGCEPRVNADIQRQDKRLGDIWLICSDGLYNMVDDGEIEQTLASFDEMTAADKLLKSALEHGGSDNVSFVICRVTEVTAV